MLFCIQMVSYVTKMTVLFKYILKNAKLKALKKNRFQHLAFK